MDEDEILFEPDAADFEWALMGEEDTEPEDEGGRTEEA